MQCHVCKKTTGQLYQEISTGLVYCSFIEGQKRGREDEDEQLMDRFKSTLSYYTKAKTIKDEKEALVYEIALVDIVDKAIDTMREYILEAALESKFISPENGWNFMWVKHVETVKFALRNKLVAINDPKAELLFYAVDNDIDDVVKFLLENGADPNMYSMTSKELVFEYAISVHQFNIVVLLVKYGAKITFETVRNAFHWAEEFFTEGIEDDATDEEKQKQLQESDAGKVLLFILNNMPPDLDLLAIRTMDHNVFDAIGDKIPYLRMLFITFVFSHYRLQRLPSDVSRKILAERLRNILCKELSDERLSKSFLLSLAEFLGVPKEVRVGWSSVSKDKLCSYVSTIVAIGAIWDTYKFTDRRAKLRAQKDLERAKVQNALEKFKRAVQVLFDVDTEGKTVDQLLQEMEELI